MNIGVLASGRLGAKTLKVIWDHNLRPLFLFTDKRSIEIHRLASDWNVPVFIGSPRSGRAIKMLAEARMEVDLLLSINYLFLIDRDLIDFSRYGCVNFHGSLLPKYRGRTPHIWAIINNETETGITAHFVDEGCDSGAVISQHKIRIFPDHTGADLLSIFEQQYPKIVLDTIKLFETNEVFGVSKAQDATKATFFGKRTPVDGLINWSWQKERIHNWVRAQANPYPGAFTFYGATKVIIDKIEYCETGYRYDDPDGLILVGGLSPEIKTPNGAIRVVESRAGVSLEPGIILGENANSI